MGADLEKRTQRLRRRLDAVLAPKGRSYGDFVRPVLEGVCRQHGYDEDDPLVFANLLALLLAENLGGWERNDRLFGSADLVHSPTLPTGESHLSCLYGWYWTPRSNTEMSTRGASRQAARPAMALRNAGFRFASNKEGDTKDGVWVWYEGNEPYRMIIGHEEPSATWNASWNKLPREMRRSLRQHFSPDFLGVPFTTKQAQIDHRMPEDARRRLSVAAVPLTVDSVLCPLPDDYWSLNSPRVVRGIYGEVSSWAFAYQVVSTLTNTKKREACAKCLAGKEIPLPAAAEPFRSAYKRRYDEGDDLGCCGCFWFDHLRPRHEDLFPAEDLEAARVSFVDALLALQASVAAAQRKKR